MRMPLVSLGLELLAKLRLRDDDQTETMTNLVMIMEVRAEIPLANPEPLKIGMKVEAQDEDEDMAMVETVEATMTVKAMMEAIVGGEPLIGDDGQEGDGTKTMRTRKGNSSHCT